MDQDLSTTLKWTLDKSTNQSIYVLVNELNIPIT